MSNTSKTDWSRIDMMKDEDIDTADISWLFVTCYGSIGEHKSTKSLSGKRLN